MHTQTCGITPETVGRITVKIRLFQQCEPADQESNPEMKNKSDERQLDFGELQLSWMKSNKSGNTTLGIA